MGVRLYPIYREQGDSYILDAKFLGYRPIDGVIARQYEEVSSKLERTRMKLLGERWQRISARMTEMGVDWDSATDEQKYASYTPEPDIPDLAYELYEFFINKLPRASRVHDFALFGWGKFDYPVDDCVGATYDRKTMRALLASTWHGASLNPYQWEKLAGISWS